MTYGLSFLCMAASLAGAGWTGGSVPFFLAVALVAALGHIVSALGWGRRVRLAVVIYPLAVFAIWSMRAELWGAVQGASLLPLAKLLTIIQMLVSFNLRSLRTLYDTLILDLLVVLLASQGALSGTYLVLLGFFAMVTMLFLASASTDTGSQRRLRTSHRQPFLLLGTLIGVIAFVFIAALASFLALPQRYRTPGTVALPSRLDVTLGRPIAPAPFASSSALADPSVLPSLASDLALSADAGVYNSEASVEPGFRTALGGSRPQPNSRYASLGYIGSDDEDVVMRVRSPVASYWRGQVLEIYDGRGWSEPSLGSFVLVDSRGNIRFRDTPPPAEGTGRYVQTFYLRASQPNAVFTGYSPGYVVALDPRNDRGAPGPNGLPAVDSYRVISSLPSATPASLRQDQADASYRQGLKLPASVPTRVKDLALSVTAGAASDYDKAARLEGFLRTAYTYDLRVQPLPPARDAADSFLFERQSGYCSQFATAMAVMARLVGLPSRVATGYVPGTYDSLAGVYTVRRQDAHAWVEIKFRDHGWVPFDPTPRPDIAEAFDVGYTVGAQSLQGLMRSTARDILRDGSSSLLAVISGSVHNRSLWIIGYAALLGTIGFSLAAWLFVRYRASRSADHWRAYSQPAGPGRREVVAAYARALQALARKGFPERRLDQSPQEYVLDLAARGFPVPDAFQRLSANAARALYSGLPQDPAATWKARSDLAAVRAVAKVPKDKYRPAAAP